MIKDKLYSTYLDAIRDKVAERHEIELSGTPPLSFTSKGKPLTAWSITGNTVQNGTPTPENPVEVQAVGDRTANLFDFDTVYSTYKQPDGTYRGTVNNFYITHITPFTSDDIGKTFTFTIVVKETTSINVRAIANINGNYINGNNLSAAGTASVTFTVSSVNDYLYLGYGSGGKNIITLDNIMLYEGSTALPYEPYGYKIPVVTSADGTEPVTTPIYLPTPLYSGEVMRSDGTITRSDGTTETFTAPQIPTLNGTTVIDVNTAVKPENMTIKYKAV